MFPHSLAAPELAERSLVRISDVHLDVRLLWQWGKRDSPIVGRIIDAAQSAAARLRRYVVLAVPLHPTDPG